MALITPMGQFPHMNPAPKDRDLDTFVRGLERAMEEGGWKMKPLSEAAGLGETAVKDLFRKRSSPKVSTAHALAVAMGRSVDEILALGMSAGSPMSRHAIAVAGHVGAGAQVDLFDAYPKGDGHYKVACPPQIDPRGVVAVEVVGDSMAPVYPPGTVLFYTREVLGVPTEALGRICVCEDDGGRAWVKQVKTGSAEGTFSLISINPTADTMHGVRLRWAAPVRFSLPPEFVERIDP